MFCIKMHLYCIDYTPCSFGLHEKTIKKAAHLPISWRMDCSDKLPFHRLHLNGKCMLSYHNNFLGNRHINYIRA